MPPTKSAKGGREWTNFEKHTLLCLLAKGKHLEVDHGKKSDDFTKVKQSAYLNISSELNKAVHRDDFRNDLDKKDVARMIDKMLLERKGVVGRGGYMERQAVPRITRGLKRLWERPTKFDYDGSLGEWKLGRKKVEQEKLRIAKGGTPAEDTIMISIEDQDEITAPAPARVSKPSADYWSQADLAAATSRAKWRGNETALPTANQDKGVNETRPTTTVDTGHDAFRNLPPTLQKSDRFQWIAGSLPSKPIYPVLTPSVTSRVSAELVHPSGSDRGHYNPSLVASLVGPGPAREQVPSTRPLSTTAPSYSTPSYGILSQPTPLSSYQSSSRFSGTRVILPAKPPRPASQPRAPGTDDIPFVANHYQGNIINQTPQSQENPCISSFDSRSTSGFGSPNAPASSTSVLLSRNVKHPKDDRLAQSINSELLTTNNRKRQQATLPAKSEDIFHEAINPARRAMMEAEASKEHMESDKVITNDKDFGPRNRKTGRTSKTNANTEILPFNRMDT